MNWAAIKTVSGKIVMDSVGRDTNITHEISIRYDNRVTSEHFVQSDDGRRFRIVSIENLEERGEYIKLFTIERGLDEAAKT